MRSHHSNVYLNIEECTTETPSNQQELVGYVKILRLRMEDLSKNWRNARVFENLCNLELYEFL